MYKEIDLNFLDIFNPSKVSVSSMIPVVVILLLGITLITVAACLRFNYRKRVKAAAIAGKGAEVPRPIDGFFIANFFVVMFIFSLIVILWPQTSSKSHISYNIAQKYNVTDIENRIEKVPNTERTYIAYGVYGETDDKVKMKVLFDDNDEPHIISATRKTVSSVVTNEEFLRK